MTDHKQRPKPNEALERVIQKAGGITSLAATLGMTEGGVRYWQRRGAVPPKAAKLLAYEAAAKLGMEVSAEELSGE